MTNWWLNENLTFHECLWWCICRCCCDKSIGLNLSCVFLSVKNESCFKKYLQIWAKLSTSSSYLGTIFYINYFSSIERWRNREHSRICHWAPPHSWIQHTVQWLASLLVQTKTHLSSMGDFTRIDVTSLNDCWGFALSLSHTHLFARERESFLTNSLIPCTNTSCWACLEVIDKL